jgi:hypothetical protein
VTHLRCDVTLVASNALPSFSSCITRIHDVGALSVQHREYVMMAQQIALCDVELEIEYINEPAWM